MMKSVAVQLQALLLYPHQLCIPVLGHTSAQEISDVLVYPRDHTYCYIWSWIFLEQGFPFLLSLTVLEVLF